MSTPDKKAVILLSGGLDSTTVCAITMDRGFTPCVMSFCYGQRHDVELDAFTRVADALDIKKRVIVDIDLRLFGGSALTDDIHVPKNRSDDSISSGIPVTYVPARNTIFLSYALAWSETIGAHDIFLGVNAVDYSGYPDCRPEYIEAYQTMANLATKEGVEGKHITIHTPLMNMSKSEIIRTGVSLNVDYSLTHSCYDPDIQGRACGQCDSCLLRKKGFSEAGIADPTIYTDS